MDANFSARVRQKFRTACRELKIDPAPILKQFDCWRYPENDLLEMGGWDKSTVKKHCQLLAHEVEIGLDPHNLPRAVHKDER